MNKILLSTIIILIITGTLIVPFDYIHKLPETPVTEIPANDTSIHKIHGLYWATDAEHKKSSVIRFTDDMGNDYICNRSILNPQLLLDVHELDHGTPLVIIGRLTEKDHYCRETGTEWPLNIEAYIAYVEGADLSTIPPFKTILPAPVITTFK